MILLDTAGLPAGVVSALMARGAQTLPLLWVANPNRHAKAVLDAVPDDTLLLEHDPLADDAMGAAARALLYFWNGWPAEARMHGSLAHEPERLYIEALCRRQADGGAASKELFQEINGHPLFPELAAYALDAISASVASPLKRLRQTILFADQWEPFAFADMFDQAQLGKLDPTGEQIVRNLQSCEFELLLAHCLDAAVGQPLVRRQKSATERRRPASRPPARRPVDRPHAQHPAPASKPTPPEKEEPRQPQIGKEFYVLCPKCQAKLIVAETSRGTTTRCDNCAATFLVPERALGPLAGR